MDRTDTDTRIIVVGRNSSVWKRVSSLIGNATPTRVELSHSDVSSFGFNATDVVWVLSYAKDVAVNARMLDTILAAGVSRLLYVSSSSCIVSERTDCYVYPRIKQAAAGHALASSAARILVIGQVYGSPEELPRGTTVATSLRQLADYLGGASAHSAADRIECLFGFVTRPFSGRFEAWLYHSYSRLLLAMGRYPCVLRPIDAVLRLLGVKWYGYVRLSTLLWSMRK